MRETDEELEKSLGSLKPAPASQGLEAKIAEKISKIDTPLLGKRPMAAIAAFAILGTAACAAIALLLLGGRGPVPVAEESVVRKTGAPLSIEPEFEVAEEIVKGFEPIQRLTEVLAADRSAVFYLENGTPAQSVYVRYLDTLLMGNDDVDASIVISAPREEYRVVPIVSY